MGRDISQFFIQQSEVGEAGVEAAATVKGHEVVSGNAGPEVVPALDT